MSNESPGGFVPLTPPPEPRPNVASLDDDARAMKSGKGGMIAGAAAVGLLVLGGGAWLAFGGTPDVYGPAGREINGLRQSHFDAFWGCALPRADLRDIAGAEALLDAIDERAQRPQAYAEHVRGECMVHLDEHLPPLTLLEVPEDMRPEVEHLRASVEEQRTAWRALLEHLDRAESFDREDAETGRLLTAVAHGWFEYKRAHGALNTTVRAHITE